MRSRDRFRARPVLERLEAREVLSTYLWIANPMGNTQWSTATNWVETTTGVKAAPVNGDSVIFDPNMALAINGNNYTGSQANAGDDIANLTLNCLNVRSGYAGTVSTPQTLHVNGAFNLDGGQVADTNWLYVDAGGNFEWSGGKIGINLAVGAVGGARATTLISGPGGHRIEDNCELKLLGDTSWAGGAISMGDGASLVNGSGGVFNTTAGAGCSIYFAGNGPAPLLVNPVTKPTFLNSGTLNRTGGNVTVQCNIPFENQGTVNVSSGTLRFLDDYQQTAGTTNVTSTGILSVDRQHTLSLAAGNFYGTSTVYGNVVNSGATVSPGTAVDGGLLTIKGYYTQQNGGTLNIRIKDATSGINIQNWGKLGGKATLGGTLLLTRVAPYAPAVGTIIKPIQATQAGGAFANTTIQNNAWTVGGANGVHFDTTRKATGLELKANAPAPPPVQQATAILLTASAAGIQAGQAVTFTVTVTTSGPAPTEAFILLNDEVLGTVALTPAGGNTYVGTCTTSAIQAGQYTLTAVLDGTEELAPAFSSPVALSVASPSLLAASLSLALNQTTAYPDDLVEITATVSAPGLATGRVAFYDNGNLLGYGTVDANGVADFYVVQLSTGTHAITATYLGDANFDTSLASPIQLTYLVPLNGSSGGSVGGT
jgi:hypothetical protein